MSEFPYNASGDAKTPTDSNLAVAVAATGPLPQPAASTLIDLLPKAICQWAREKALHARNRQAAHVASNSVPQPPIDRSGSQ